jgi:hypothetical protein
MGIFNKKKTLYTYTHTWMHAQQQLVEHTEKTRTDKTRTDKTRTDKTRRPTRSVMQGDNVWSMFRSHLWDCICAFAAIMEDKELVAGGKWSEVEQRMHA